MQKALLYILVLNAFLYSTITFAQQEPFNGTPWTLPGQIEIEDYDKGGSDVAYHETTNGNEGGVYRTDDVDIQSCSEGGYNVGWTAQGEWLEYTVDVKEAKTYFVSLRVAAPSASGKYRVEFNGENKTGTVSVPSTGGWQVWKTLATEVDLDAGEQVMRVYLEGPDFNINWISVTNEDPNVGNEYWDNLLVNRAESDNLVTWQQAGPGNAGFSNLLRYHPALPDVVSFCPDMFNNYQSDNNGKSWYNIKDYDGNGEFFRLFDIQYSANNTQFGLALEGSHLWKTNDTGKTWTKVGYCPWYFNGGETDLYGWQAKVATLAIDLKDDNTWYVGGGAHVRGQYPWSAMTGVTAAKPHGKSHDYEGKIWKTTDAGASWTLVTTGLSPQASAVRIITHPENSNTVFAATNYGLYKSVDAGTTWVNAGEGKLDNNIIIDMDYYYDAASGNFILYVIDQVQYLANGNTTKTTGGIFKSADQGDTWVNINGDLYLDINRLTGGVPYNYYQYIAKWFGQSVNQVQSQYPTLPTNALQYFNSLNVDPSRPDALYVGFADPQIQNSIIPGRLWVTSNGGQKWINTARMYGEAWENDKAYWQERGNPTTQNMTLGHAPFSQQWGSNYPLRSLRHCAVNSRGDVMIIAAHNTLLSTDNGATWQQVDEDYTEDGNIMGRGNSNLPGETLYQDKRMGEGKLWLGAGEHYLWKPSLDGSDGRIALEFFDGAQETVSSITTHPLNENIVYTTSFRQHHKETILRSDDGGYTWQEWGTATPAEWQMRTHSLMMDAQNANYMYFGITDKDGVDANKEAGFYFSDDEGRSFTPRNSGLPANARIRDIEVDPRDESGASLFAAAEYAEFNLPTPVQGGLYHTSNRGVSWTKVNTHNSIKGVNHISLDNTGRMYITTGFRGSGAGAWYSDDWGETWTNMFKLPNTQCIDVSPFDNNLLLVTVGNLQKNPGIYISEDRGKTWSKNNTNIPIPDLIKLIEFDLHDPSVIWLASVGCGFYKGTYTNASKAHMLKVTPGVYELDGETELQLNAELLSDTYTTSDVQWKSANPTIASVDENGKVIPKRKGQVKIWASVDNERFSDFALLTVKQGVVSTKQILHQQHVSIYPNPVKSDLKIASNSKIIEVSVLSISGTEVASFNKQEIYNVGDLPTGMYLLKIKTDNGYVNQRFVKE